MIYKYILNAQRKIVIYEMSHSCIEVMNNDFKTFQNLVDACIDFASYSWEVRPSFAVLFVIYPSYKFFLFMIIIY